MARRRVVLCCRACGAEVTTPAQAISVRDAHEHHVFNPAGVLFRIGCFAEAPGVRPVGPRSDQFTWFPGHTWTVTVCAACGRHLGWLFRPVSGSGAFHALILDRLVETGGEDEG
ncbi:cereblon family protein [uncultured Rhodospira sp.]|uniref:cereblon family protein n=1 Tax=uncultured Rhodospira sp. TaxID=1936189 RepID=UPI00260EB457|nr:cereblon family protein [uncultured Rhodospira sp.]